MTKAAFITAILWLGLMSLHAQTVQMPATAAAAPAVRFVGNEFRAQLAGADRSQWILTNGVAVPVLFDEPPRSYTIMGWVVIDADDVLRGREERLKRLNAATRSAKEHSADALWLCLPGRGQYLLGVAISYRSAP